MRAQQTIKKLLSDFFFVVALFFALNSDRLVTLIEDALTPGSEPGALTKLLDSKQVVRVSFTVAVSELWTILITQVWNFGYWTGEIFSIFHIFPEFLVKHLTHLRQISSLQTNCV